MIVETHAEDANFILLLNVRNLKSIQTEKAFATLKRERFFLEKLLCRISFFDVIDFNGFWSFPTEQNEFWCAIGIDNIPAPYVHWTYYGFLFTGFFDGWHHDDYIKIDLDYVSLRGAGWDNVFSGLLDSVRGLRILDYWSGASAFEETPNNFGIRTLHHIIYFLLPPGMPREIFGT